MAHTEKEDEEEEEGFFYFPGAHDASLLLLRRCRESDPLFCSDACLARGCEKGLCTVPLFFGGLREGSSSLSPFLGGATLRKKREHCRPENVAGGGKIVLLILRFCKDALFTLPGKATPLIR